ncbi:MAG: hypothetical protein JJT94_14560 [Bernardetiaceae bacterium]|nr:hypothetical protein [Bernardetiaceae bacterium]
MAEYLEKLRKTIEKLETESQELYSLRALYERAEALENKFAENLTHFGSIQQEWKSYRETLEQKAQNLYDENQRAKEALLESAAQVSQTEQNLQHTAEQFVAYKQILTEKTDALKEASDSVNANNLTITERLADTIEDFRIFKSILANYQDEISQKLETWEVKNKEFADYLAQISSSQAAFEARNHQFMSELSAFLQKAYRKQNEQSTLAIQKGFEASAQREEVLLQTADKLSAQIRSLEQSFEKKLEIWLEENRNFKAQFKDMIRQPLQEQQVAFEQILAQKQEQLLGESQNQLQIYKQNQENLLKAELEALRKKYSRSEILTMILGVLVILQIVLFFVLK